MVDNRDRLKAMMAAKLKEKRAQGAKAPTTRKKTPGNSTSARRMRPVENEGPHYIGKVVIAEADKRLQALLANALKTLHLEPITTDNGMEAAMYLQVETPLMVVVDQKLPDMSGAQACNRIRELDNGLMLPVLMVTASTEKAVLQEAVDAGVTGYMGKPLNIAQFLQRVKDLIHYDQLIAKGKTKS